MTLRVARRYRRGGGQRLRWRVSLGIRLVGPRWKGSPRAATWPRCPSTRVGPRPDLLRRSHSRAL